MDTYHRLLITIAVVLVGCSDDPPVAMPGTTGTTGASSSTTADPPGDTTEGTSTGTMLESTGPGASTSTSGNEPSTSGEATTVVDTTGTPGGPCVDKNVGSMLGNEVADGATAGAGNDFAFEDCDGSADPFPGPDYVIEWTAPRAGMYTFTLVDSDFDTVLALISPECGTQATLDCNDDCESFTSAIGYDAQAGETVYIVIEGYWGTDGHFSLDIYEGVEPDCCSNETWGYCGSTGWWSGSGSTGWWSSSGTGWWGSSSDTEWSTDTDGGWWDSTTTTF